MDNDVIQAIKNSLPSGNTRPRRRTMLCVLARELKCTKEGQKYHYGDNIVGTKVACMQLREAVQYWYQLLPDWAKNTKGRYFYDYWTMFTQNVFPYTKKSADEGFLVDAAKHVNHMFSMGQLSKVANEFDSPDIQKLIMLCEYIQRERSRNAGYQNISFVLSYSSIAKILDIPPMTAHGYMAVLVAEKRIEKVENGTTPKELQRFREEGKPELVRGTKWIMYSAMPPDLPVHSEIQKPGVAETSKTMFLEKYPSGSA